MKMLLAIVHNEDAPLLINELNEKKYFVTKLATTGGFLKKGNTTLLLGIEDEKVDAVCEIIKHIPASVSRSCIPLRLPPIVMYIPTLFPAYP